MVPSLNWGQCLTFGYGLYKFSHLLGILANAIPVGSWELHAFLGSGTFCWLPLFPIFHCYTPLFTFLVLCTSPLFPPTPNLVRPFFPLPLLSLSQIPHTINLLWLLCSLLQVGLKHPNFGLPSSWPSYCLWVVSWVFPRVLLNIHLSVCSFVIGLPHSGWYFLVPSICLWISWSHCL